jgi:hypothetical protein
MAPSCGNLWRPAADRHGNDIADTGEASATDASRDAPFRA